MTVEICRGEAELLARYAQVPIAFEVASVLNVELVEGGLEMMLIWYLDLSRA